jgi:peroxiredoxin
VEQLVKLQDLVPAKDRAKTAILAIAPDKLDVLGNMAANVKKKLGREDFSIILLGDADHAVIDGYGLLNEQAATRGRFLPHPTTYVIDEKGVVRWKFTEKDYKIRPSNEEIAAELNKLR